jgi:hypothetical protein
MKKRTDSGTSPESAHAGTHGYTGWIVIAEEGKSISTGRKEILADARQSFEDLVLE